MTDLTQSTSEAITLLSSMISIPSVSREEEKVADFLQTYIEGIGIMTGRSGNNIWCISPMFDMKKPTILLNSHIDTIKPSTVGESILIQPKWRMVSFMDSAATMRVPV